MCEYVFEFSELNQQVQVFFHHCPVQLGIPYINECCKPLIITRFHLSKTFTILVAPPITPKEEEKPVAPAEPPAAKTPGKYVPPSMRGGAGATPSEPTRPTPLRRKKVAPNLQSEDDFPTLGGGPMGDQRFVQL